MTPTIVASLLGARPRFRTTGSIDAVGVTISAAPSLNVTVVLDSTFKISIYSATLASGCSGSLSAFCEDEYKFEDRLALVSVCRLYPHEYLGCD